MDARVLEPSKLAGSIREIINDKEKYYDFFKWLRYYSLHDPYESPETDEICALCKFLNNDRNTNKITIYDNINKFWS